MKNILFFLGFTLILFSCQKTKNETTNPEQQLSQVVSEQDAQSESSYTNLFDDVMGASNEVGIYGSGVFGKESGLDTVVRCFQVNVEHPNFPAPFPVIVTITYPQSGCVGRDGRVRRGVIKTVYTNRLTVFGAQSTTTFMNYSVDSVSLNGTFLIRNVSDTTLTPPQPRWLLKVTGGRLGYPNGNVVEWQSEKLLTQTEGYMTAIPMDDIFKLTGSASGASIRNGQATQWTSQIIEPLVKRFNCFWIVQGIVKTTRTTLSNTSPWIATLNFGNGECDNLATLTVNGVTTIIHLR